MTGRAGLTGGTHQKSQRIIRRPRAHGPDYVVGSNCQIGRPTSPGRASLTRRGPNGTTQRTPLATSTTCSAVKPFSAMSSEPPAEAPKCSMLTEAPPAPT